MNPVTPERFAPYAGAENGYIMKQEATEKVPGSHSAHPLSGKVYLSEKLTNKACSINLSIGAQSLQDRSRGEAEMIVNWKIYRLIGAGHTTRQIADALHVSVKTIESYQAHIKEKLGFRNARELVQHAIE